MTNGWSSIRASSSRARNGQVLDAHDFALDCGATSKELDLGLETDGEDALFEQPTARQLVIMSPPRTCAVLRIRQTRHAAANYWSVWELSVYERFP